jgi:BirA family transcriptional regulator, biotin operon repressor / biotin---[acetyl-CoA-carboxylase] ligase
LIRTVPETGSTSADLLAQLRSGERLPEGDWLIADRQTGGRGRMGRVWQDGAGNFMGSGVVHLRGGDPPAASLAFVAGLALLEALRPVVGDNVDLRLKWPNDVMIGNAKLAGILLEREGDAVVVGIGVNLASSPVLPDRPTIALAQTGSTASRDAFAETMANTFAAELARWRRAGLPPLLQRWQAAAHPIGTALCVQESVGGSLNGTYAGLTDDGALQLRMVDGSIRAIHAGEVLLA